MNDFQLSIISKLKSMLERIDYCEFTAYIFGSIARGDYIMTSDIDLLIVVKESTNENKKSMLRTEIDIIDNIEVQTTVVSEVYLKIGEDFFIESIRKDLVKII